MIPTDYMRTIPGVSTVVESRPVSGGGAVKLSAAFDDSGGVLSGAISSAGVAVAFVTVRTTVPNFTAHHTGFTVRVGSEVLVKEDVTLYEGGDRGDASSLYSVYIYSRSLSLSADQGGLVTASVTVDPLTDCSSVVDVVLCSMAPFV